MLRRDAPVPTLRHALKALFAQTHGACGPGAGCWLACDGFADAARGLSAGGPGWQRMELAAARGLRVAPLGPVHCADMWKTD